ncbi:Rhoptry kinase family protein ROP17, putative [Eimeria brunetti]|uniref:Rhoptry kinase family protein ROP17, putative n=1 Tax=Eimeria brunetti TaxID=51314 RepID=U6LD89_9EIME|nr:Rhoptry kinase family protein ROP17, putative [Eimeria brunetti]
MIKFSCAGAAVLAVTVVTAELEPLHRRASSFLSLGPNKTNPLTYNQLFYERRSRRQRFNNSPYESREEAIEGYGEPSIVTRAATENVDYGFTQLYETLLADANGIVRLRTVPEELLDEEQDEDETNSSSSVASLAQLHASSPFGSARQAGRAETPERQTSGAVSVLRAISRPFVAIGSAALKATRELRKYFTSPKLTCSLEVEDTKIGGKGSPAVAKAVARLGRVRKTKFLQKVDEELGIYLPRGEELVYDCLGTSKSIVLKRGFPLGSGTFGFVVPFLSSHGAVYAGKLFQVRSGARETMQNAKKQLSILNYLPPDMDATTASHRLRLALPLCVIAKQSSPTVMELPTRGRLLNAMVLFPLLRADLSYLTSVLLNTKDEDRNVLLSITQQVVRAISDLHRLSLVHLDVKLQNFLVTDKGSVLAGDLDGVKQIGSPVLPVMFTAAFAAPEVAKIVLEGDQEAKAEATMDSWSLGISIYGIWCSEYPFTADFRRLAAAEQMEILRTVPGQTLVYDIECTDRMPQEVFNLVTQFLKPNPQDRLTPMEALASHPAMRLTVPGAEDVRAAEAEELQLKEPKAEAEPLSTASTAATAEVGRPPSLSSSYVFVRPEMVAGSPSFQQQKTNISPSSANGYRFVGSQLREVKPLQQQR